MSRLHVRLKPEVESQETILAARDEALLAKIQGRLQEELGESLVAESGALSEERRHEIKQRIAAVLSEETGLDPLAREVLLEATFARIVGYGPLQGLMEDASITEIMVNGPGPIWVERSGRLSKTQVSFQTEQQIMAVLERIVAPLGRRIDEQSPMVDARLPDGSRVNAIIPPLALSGPTITIRRFPARPLRIEDLVAKGTLNQAMASFLQAAVRARLNMVVSGGTASGKCMLGRTPVRTAHGCITLAQLYAESCQRHPARIDGEGYACAPSSRPVYSCEPKSGRLRLCSALVWRHRADGPLVQVRTRSGREVTVTEEHPFWTLRHGTPCWVRAECLHVGDLLAAVGEQRSWPQATWHRRPWRPKRRTGRFFWDRVEGLLQVPCAPDGFVYDLTVEPWHTFVAGEGGHLVLHNTTTLNVLGGFIPPDERIVTLEDAAELRLQQEHVVPLETRPPNIEGRGEISLRRLVVNALRMRPDRLIVGEVRAGEALDMLQAMNTGHDGSLTTLHANAPREALSRLETMVLMAGFDLPIRAIREQISAAVHLIIQQSRLKDGSRRITHITELQGMEGDVIVLQDIFRLSSHLEHHSTGLRPRCIKLFEERGVPFDTRVFDTPGTL